MKAMTCALCGCEVARQGPHRLVFPVMREMIPGLPEGHGEWIFDYHSDGRPRFVTRESVCYGAATVTPEQLKDQGTGSRSADSPL